ncbi:uncharacterized protein LOC132724279 [Ruditapes philippinarum]|uniref:uncharacterized protein LOC132724279 n=1 Tax=Ruditapes philippinarum TaxID=129788 RepID=UPI00295B426F|nr:uncharacterized protein LOC132724279 [Ruditapes philippinarum]
MITEDLLGKKLKDLEKVIKLQVQKELDSIHKEVKVVSDGVKSIEDVIETLRNKVSDLEVKTDQLQEGNHQLLHKNKTLQEQIDEREVKVKSLGEKNNHLEQYTRCNSVRIYGVADDVSETYKDTCKKVISIISDKLQIKVGNGDFDITHRIGKFRSDGNRPIICKFVQRYLKHEVLKARRQLKGSFIVIREDLTRVNAKLLENTSAHDQVKAAWSDEGRIVA